MIEYDGGVRAVVGGRGDEDEAEAGADLLHQPDAVLELEAEGREVLDEGRAVDQLDGGAHALRPRHRLDDEVEVVLPEPRRRPARLRPPPPRRVEAEHREERPLERRLEGLRHRVHAEREAVDPVAHRHVLRPAARGSRRRRACGRRGPAGSRARCRGCSAASRRRSASPPPFVSLSRVTPCERSAASTSSRPTKRRVTRISPSFLPVSRCSTSASSSCGVVIFFIRMRMSPSRSWLLLRVCSSSTSCGGACRQNCCLYSALASQKQCRQNGHSFVGFLGSSEHQTAPTASNSPRQFQQVTR